MIGRNYIAKIKISEELSKESTGFIGEAIFEQWFNQSYQSETLHKQAADRDYAKIDFSDSKGFTYQVKATAAKTYTFNCSPANVAKHMTSNFYVFIQLDAHGYAYIERIRAKSEIENSIVQSYKNKNQCFIWKEQLNQHMLEI
tara:strand:+ start:1112 stop:1540 length:429 start_codon:yes stop_codon:yes gene_type:complete